MNKNTQMVYTYHEETKHRPQQYARSLGYMDWATQPDPKFGTPLKVLNPSRISIGSFKLDIQSGKWRYLTLDEEKILMANLDG